MTELMIIVIMEVLLVISWKEKKLELNKKLIK